MVRLRIAGLIIGPDMSQTNIIRLIEDSVLRNRFPPKKLYNQQVVSVSRPSASSSLQTPVTIQTEQYTVHLYRRVWDVGIKKIATVSGSPRKLRKHRVKHVNIDMLTY